MLPLKFSPGLLVFVLLQAALYPVSGRAVPFPAKQLLEAGPQQEAEFNASSWDALAQVSVVCKNAAGTELGCVYLPKVFVWTLYVQGLVSTQETALNVVVWLTNSISIPPYGSLQPLQIYRYLQLLLPWISGCASL
jgi:hypothetical protein